jgi:dTDP-4-amino-4,6-dideoxygalactose transaminase
MSNFGFYGYDNVVMAGTNGKMSEICAAMGITGLERLNTVIDHNRNNYECYRNELKDCPGIKFYDHRASHSRAHNHQYVLLEVDAGVAKIGRDNVMATMWAENILARRYFYPSCHRMEPYASAGVGYDLPNCEYISDRILVLPTGTSVSVEDIHAICSIIRIALQYPDEINRRLSPLSGAAKHEQ